MTVVFDDQFNGSGALQGRTASPGFGGGGHWDDNYNSLSTRDGALYSYTHMGAEYTGAKNVSLSSGATQWYVDFAWTTASSLSSGQGGGVFFRFTPNNNDGGSLVGIFEVRSLVADGPLYLVDPSGAKHPVAVLPDTTYVGRFTYSVGQARYDFLGISGVVARDPAMEMFFHRVGFYWSDAGAHGRIEYLTVADDLAPPPPPPPKFWQLFVNTHEVP